MSGGAPVTDIRFHYVKVTDDTSRAEILQTICHLRAKSLGCELQAVRDEIAEDIDDLLDLLLNSAPTESA